MPPAHSAATKRPRAQQRRRRQRATEARRGARRAARGWAATARRRPHPLVAGCREPSSGRWARRARRAVAVRPSRR
eukprot:6459580-Prymnesium_polylepis.1